MRKPLRKCVASRMPNMVQIRARNACRATKLHIYLLWLSALRATTVGPDTSRIFHECIFVFYRCCLTFHKSWFASNTCLLCLFGMSEKTTSRPSVFSLPPQQKESKMYLGFPVPLQTSFGQENDFTCVKYTRSGYITVTY